MTPEELIIITIITITIIIIIITTLLHITLLETHTFTLKSFPQQHKNPTDPSLKEGNIRCKRRLSKLLSQNSAELLWWAVGLRRLWRGFIWCRLRGDPRISILWSIAQGHLLQSWGVDKEALLFCSTSTKMNPSYSQKLKPVSLGIQLHWRLYIVVQPSIIHTRCWWKMNEKKPSAPIKMVDNCTADCLLVKLICERWCLQLLC